MNAKVRRIVSFPTYVLYEWIFNPVYRKRVAGYVAAMCDDNSRVLDVGCNDGTVAMLIKAAKPSLRIEGLDIQGNVPCKIRRAIYDGKRMPFPDNSFDVVVAVDVLHHTTDMLPVLKEMKRVAKKYVIIKDQVARGPVTRGLLALCDIAANFHYGIRCTFNYPSNAEWYDYFRKAGLRLVEEPKRLSFGFGFNEWLSPLFKLRKN